MFTWLMGLKVFKIRGLPKIFHSARPGACKNHFFLLPLYILSYFSVHLYVFSLSFETLIFIPRPLL